MLSTMTVWYFQYFGPSIVIYWSNFEIFVTKMAVEKSSKKFNRRKKLCEAFVFLADYSWKCPNLSLKFWNFPEFYSSFSSYEGPVILLNPVFHGLSFGIKLEKYFMHPVQLKFLMNIYFESLICSNIIINYYNHDIVSWILDEGI